jgi:hypothetical protein
MLPLLLGNRVTAGRFSDAPRVIVGANGPFRQRIHPHPRPLLPHGDPPGRGHPSHCEEAFVNLPGTHRKWRKIVDKRRGTELVGDEGIVLAGCVTLSRLRFRSFQILGTSYKLKWVRKKAVTPAELQWYAPMPKLEVLRTS